MALLRKLFGAVTGRQGERPSRFRAGSRRERDATRLAYRLNRVSQIPVVTDLLRKVRASEEQAGFLFLFGESCHCLSDFAWRLAHLRDEDDEADWPERERIRSSMDDFGAALDASHDGALNSMRFWAQNAFGEGLAAEELISAAADDAELILATFFVTESALAKPELRDHISAFAKAVADADLPNDVSVIAVYCLESTNPDRLVVKSGELSGHLGEGINSTGVANVAVINDWSPVTAHDFQFWRAKWQARMEKCFGRLGGNALDEAELAIFGDNAGAGVPMQTATTEIVQRLKT